MSSGVVLDASALLCLLLSEPGSERVEALIDGSSVSAVNYCEVVTKLVDRGIDADDIVADLANLSMTVVPVDRDMAELAARLRLETRHVGLSLGDRTCLALARLLGAEVLTTDRLWSSVGERLNVRVTLLR